VNGELCLEIIEQTKTASQCKLRLDYGNGSMTGCMDGLNLKKGKDMSQYGKRRKREAPINLSLPCSTVGFWDIKIDR